MRSVRLLAVAVLALVLVLFSAGNAFAIQIDMHPTCGQPPPVELTVTGLSGDVFITVTIWGSGWEGFGIVCLQEDNLNGDGDNLNGVVECTLSGFGTTGGFTLTFRDDFSSASATYTVDCPAVGGVVIPANNFAVVAPWLAVIAVVGCISTAVVVASRKK